MTDVVPAPSSPLSTLTTLPSFMSTPTSPVRVKRAAVTYGRRRAPLPDSSPGADTSFILPDTSISNDNNYDTTFSEGDDDGPPPSDVFTSPEAPHVERASSEDDDEDDDGESEFQFSWRKKLREIDNEQNEDASSASPAKHKGGRVPLSDIVPLSLKRSGDATSLFGAPLPLLASTSQRTPSPSIKSPSASPGLRRITRKRNLVYDSASDGEVAISSPHTSPQRLAQINTPPAHSSPTPPTSVEMEMTRFKGKGKRRDTPPLHFEDELLPASPTVNAKRNKKKVRVEESRVKKPTMKVRIEAEKATARMVAGQTPSIQPQSKLISVVDLWQSINPYATNKRKPVKQQRQSSPVSDPIQPFSSSPMIEDTFRASTEVIPAPSTSRALPRQSVGRPVRAAYRLRTPVLLAEAPPDHLTLGSDEDEDEDIPDVDKLLQEDDAKRTEAVRRKNLTELKLRLLQQQQQQTASDGDDSDLDVVDDMQTVAREEAEDRRAMKTNHIHKSVGRKNQLSFAGPQVRARTKMLGKSNPEQMLRAAAVPTYMRTKGDKDKDAVLMNPDDLKRILLHSAANMAEEATRQKEEEWERRGGRVNRRADEGRDPEEVQRKLEAIVSKGLAAAEKREVQREEYEEDEDEEWRPETGEDNQNDNDEPSGDDALADQSEDEDAVMETDDEEIPHRRAKRFSTRPQVVSDDENDSDTYGRVLVPDSSMVLDLDSSPENERISSSLRLSLDEGTDNGTDKENNMQLMFDRGEDKENTAISREPSSSRLLFTSEPSFRRVLSNGPRGVLVGETSEQRTPLQELSSKDDDLDDPFMSSPSLRASRHLRADSVSPLRGKLTSPGLGTALFEPLNTLKGNEKGEASSEGDFFGSVTPMALASGVHDKELPSSLEPAPAIMQGISRLFEAGSVRSPEPVVPGGMSQFFTQDGNVLPPQRNPKTDALALSLDVGLRPALEISGSLRQKADAIFEKEQEYVVETVNSKLAPKAQLYVSAHGFLTQTRPEAPSPSHLGVTPLRNVMTTMFSPAVGTSASRTRQPLAPLDIGPDSDGPDTGSLRRLKKRPRSPTEDEYDGRRLNIPSSPIERKTLNAFDVLGKKPVLPRPRLQKSEFIEGEADESDEEAMFGFGLRKHKDDDEEDGEDQDQTLAELVDDTVMDEKTLAEQAVLEKVREHQEEDDRALEKVHRDAVDGKFRTKRRDRGVGFEDSDSDEDEDEEARRLRRKLNKKRRIDGDTLEELAKNKETLAFVEAYNADLEDDNEEFAHLQHDDLTLIQDTDADAEDEEPQEVVSMQVIRDEIREVSRGQKLVETMDPHDLSWIEDAEREDETIRVKEVSTLSQTKSGARRPAVQDQSDWIDSFEQSGHIAGDDEETQARMKSWARGEGMSRNTGTTHFTGISAVTGHGRATKGKGGTVAQRALNAATASSSRKPAKLAKAPSMLSAVPSRKSKFGS